MTTKSGDPGRSGGGGGGGGSSLDFGLDLGPPATTQKNISIIKTNQRRMCLLIMNNTNAYMELMISPQSISMPRDIETHVKPGGVKS